MKSATLRLLQLALTLVVILAAAACAKPKKSGDGMDGSSAVSDSDIDAGSADSDSGKAMGLQTVYYAYDSAVLDPQAKAALKANAQVLKDKPGLKIQIEGHTDDRGGIQYNLALGERRALSAKAFIVDQGVSGDRVSAISYGKERPVSQGQDEAAWAKNRRANFRITEK